MVSSGFAIGTIVCTDNGDEGVAVGSLCTHGDLPESLIDFWQ
jgi:hypothetical protein